MDLTNYKIIPDFVLEEATCHLCFKYLTVSPIGVSSKGINICGRCSKPRKRPQYPTLLEYYGDHLEDFMPLALLGYASSRNYHFHCINRFEGCAKTLPYHYMKQHEEECLSENRNCFLCSFSGVGTQIIEHFKRKHSKHYLISKTLLSIDLNRNYEERFLYKTFKLLFQVQINFIEELKLFMMEIRYLNSIRREKVIIKCSVEIHCANDNSFYTSLSTNSISISNNFINMNFRINDLKIIDFQTITMKFVVTETETTQQNL